MQHIGYDTEIRMERMESDHLCGRLGDRMIREMLERRTGIPQLLLPIKRDENGKPYLEGGGWHFNISHTKGLVIAAVSRVPVGIDVEREDRKIRYALARICSEEDQRYAEGGEDIWKKDTKFTGTEGMEDIRTEEKEDVGAGENAERDIIRRRMEIWTRKEALVKCIGCGIFGAPMKETVGSGERTLQIGEETYRLWTIRPVSGYVGALCLRTDGGRQ